MKPKDLLDKILALKNRKSNGFVSHIGLKYKNLLLEGEPWASNFEPIKSQIKHQVFKKSLIKH